MGSKDSQIDPGIAVTPNDIAALPRLLSDVTDLVNGLVAHGEVDRRELLVKCRSMVQAIETPRETMVKHCWAQVGTWPLFVSRYANVQTGTFAAINFGVDCGLWKLMAQNGDRSQQVSELATKLRVDEILLGTLLVRGCSVYLLHC